LTRHDFLIDLIMLQHWEKNRWNCCHKRNRPRGRGASRLRGDRPRNWNAQRNKVRSIV